MGWLVKLGDALSQFGNVLFFGGDPNYSISGDSYRYNIRWRVRLIDAIFGSGHCEQAWRNDLEKARKLLTEVSTAGPLRK